MSRIYKFRAWVEEAVTGVAHMVNPPTMPVAENEVILFDGTVLFLTEDLVHDTAKTRIYLPGQVTLMQFTGLKDKNGVEIYEGDIVESVLTNQGKKYPPMLVEWIPYLCAYRLSMVSDPTDQDGGDFNLEESDRITPGVNSYLEIIGNVYENPELLGSKKNVNERSTNVNISQVNVNEKEEGA